MAVDAKARRDIQEIKATDSDNPDEISRLSRISRNAIDPHNTTRVKTRAIVAADNIYDEKRYFDTGLLYDSGYTNSKALSSVTNEDNTFVFYYQTANDFTDTTNTTATVSSTGLQFSESNTLFQTDEIYMGSGTIETVTWELDPEDNYGYDFTVGTFTFGGTAGDGTGFGSGVFGGSDKISVSTDGSTWEQVNANTLNTLTNQGTKLYTKWESDSGTQYKWFDGEDTTYPMNIKYTRSS